MEADVLPKSSASASEVYHRLARYYDRVFEPVYSKRIHATIRSLEIPEDARALDIGVGTGISLPAYPRHAEVLGVDISQEMLDQAAKRLESDRRNIDLQRMDALDLRVPSDHFDYVMVFHVVSVVEDVERMMGEIFRACKPGGKIVVINHFRSRRRWLAAVVDKITPITKRLGWRTDLRREEVTDPFPLRVDQQFKTSPFSLFTVLVATKPDVPTSGQERPEAPTTNGTKDTKRRV